MIDSNVGGWGWVVNYQMQIVTKLPNENIQTYQLQIFHVKLKNEVTIAFGSLPPPPPESIICSW